MQPRAPAACALAVCAQDALCGSILSVPTLDGRTLSIGLTEVVHPGYVKTVPGEGMPIPHPPAGAAAKGANAGPARKGDLQIEFEIAFPQRLTPAQRQAVHAIKM
jgi:DnaJ-class molecular chaperone